MLPNSNTSKYGRLLNETQICNTIKMLIPKLVHSNFTSFNVRFSKMQKSDLVSNGANATNIRICKKNCKLPSLFCHLLQVNSAPWGQFYQIDCVCSVQIFTPRMDDLMVSWLKSFYWKTHKRSISNESTATFCLLQINYPKIIIFMITYSGGNIKIIFFLLKLLFHQNYNKVKIIKVWRWLIT
jgi:hypothetical protein